MTARTMIEKLRQHVSAANDSQLANALDVDRPLISKAVNGKTAGFTLPVLHRMAVAADLPIGQLAEWWAEGRPHPDAE